MADAPKFMHDPRTVECFSIFAGPCSCGPAIHVNLSRSKEEPIFATCRLHVDEIDELVRQLKKSKRALLKAAKTFPIRDFKADGRNPTQ